LLDDTSDTGQTNEAACHTRRVGSNNWGYVSEWDDGAGAWTPNNYAGATHVRVNNGDFSGVDIACNLADMGFTFTYGSDKAAAVSGDSGNNEFMNSWILENTPTGGSGMDDITSYTAVPEFSSLLMPIASVILIVGYNNRLKRKYSNQH
jgi:hypothetical protein